MKIDIPTLNKKSIELLTQLVFGEENPKIPDKVDLIFLFGSISSIPKRKKVLDNLLKKKICDKVLLSGGINFRRKEGATHRGNFGLYDLHKITEAEILEKEMELNKFQDVKIYKEEKSTSTLENVKFSLDVLKFNNYKNILFITRSYHVGRCYLTLRKYVSKHTNIFYQSYDSKIKKGINKTITRDNWYKFEDGKNIVWREFKKIKLYGEIKNNIEFEEVKDLVGEIEESLENKKLI